MKEYVILLVDDNNANTRWAIEKIALDLFGGYTLGSRGQGAWLDQETGTLHKDETTPLFIATDDETKLLQFAAWIKNLLAQIAVYVRFPDGTVRFI